MVCYDLDLCYKQSSGNKIVFLFPQILGYILYKKENLVVFVLHVGLRAFFMNMANQYWISIGYIYQSIYTYPFLNTFQVCFVRLSFYVYKCNRDRSVLCIYLFYNSLLYFVRTSSFFILYVCFI